MVIEKSSKSMKKRSRYPEVSNELTYQKERNASISQIPKKIKILTEIVKHPAESSKPAQTSCKPKFTISVKPQETERSHGSRKSSLTAMKSVRFAADLITSESQALGSNSTPIRTILKSPSELNGTSSLKADFDSSDSGKGHKPLESKEKKKLSKNAVKRIKWVKRHRKKTVSRRKRKANLRLARDRPQRRVQDRVAQAVAYLNTWYDSPDTWKYQKTAQLTLIKYAFNHQLIDDDTYELLLHYLAGVQGSISDRLRSMCQQIIDNNGVQPESSTLPLSIPESEDSGAVIKRAKQMLEFVLPSTFQL